LPELRLKLIDIEHRPKSLMGVIRHPPIRKKERAYTPPAPGILPKQVIYRALCQHAAAIQPFQRAIDISPHIPSIYVL
jgi:hypothetical protein